MSKTAVVYWSGTGNTETMAGFLEEAARKEGAQVKRMEADVFSPGDMMDDYDAIAFGCPAMGAEELEETEFAPMFEEAAQKLEGKKIALFGSYDWGDGEWMETWKEACTRDGAVLIYPPVIANNEPDNEAKEQLAKMAKALAAS